jgi:hypothetical protein
MTALAGLVADLRSRGVTLEPRGERLAVRPADRVTPDELEVLRQRKAEVLALLRSPPPDPAEVARVLGIPFDHLDRVVRVRVPWLDRLLWFVPTKADAARLVATGEASRGTCWTRQELLDLLAIPGITPEQIRLVAVARLEFGGEGVDVRPVLDRRNQRAQ